VAAGTELSKGRGCRDTVLLEGAAPRTPEAIRRIIHTVQRSGIDFYNHERAIVDLARIVCASQRLKVVHTVIVFVRTLRICTAAIQAVICVCNGNLPGMDLNHHIMTIRVWRAGASYRPNLTANGGSRSERLDTFVHRGRLVYEGRRVRRQKMSAMI
jgi:hypothetical protein